MGMASEYMIELAQQREQEKKEEWIVDKLEDSDEWQKLSDQYDAEAALYDNDYYPDDGWGDWDVKDKSRLEIFDETIKASTDVLETKFSWTTSRNVLVMLHGHVIAAVEGYLASTFIDQALSSEKYLRKLIENDPALTQRSISLKEIYIKKEEPENIIRKHLKDLIFHKIEKVKPLYSSVLGIDFGDVKWLFRAVYLRHDCVHRAGYTKDGEEIDLTAQSIKELISNCNDLVHRIESAVKLLPNDGSE